MTLQVRRAAPAPSTTRAAATLAAACALLAGLAPGLPPAPALGQDATVVTPPPSPVAAAPDQRVAALEGELGAAREEGAAARQEAEARGEEVRRLGAEVERLAAARAALEQELGAAGQAGESLAGELKARDDRIAMAERDLALAGEAEAAARRLLEERTAEAQRLGGQLQQATETLAAAQRQLAQVQEQGQAFQAEAGTQAERLAVAEGDLAAAREAEAAARRLLEERSGEAERLAAQAAEAGRARDALETYAAGLTKQVEQAARELVARDDRIAVLETDLEAARVAQAGAGRALDEQTALAKRLTGEVEDLRGARDALETYAAGLTKQVEQAARELVARDDRIVGLEGQLAEATRGGEEQTRELATRGERLAAMDRQLAEGRDAAEAAAGAARAEIARLEAEAAGRRSELASGGEALLAAQSEALARAQAAEAAAREAEDYRGRLEALAPHRAAFAEQARLAAGADAAVEVLAEGGRVVLQNDTLFAPRSLRLSGAGEARLRALAGSLQAAAARIPAEQPWVLRVEGHTDDLRLRPGSSFRSNFDLSAQRAAVVAEYLAEAGVPLQRLAPAGLGETRPLVDGSDEAARRRNRRIELRLMEG